mmetsp:Transcript_4048/g.12856  ORF Transcript_4048/g.12856 Transcript_4048/m.12856 type:complete len:339 (-) Transcript_4048:18-1034(-)
MREEVHVELFDEEHGEGEDGCGEAELADEVRHVGELLLQRCVLLLLSRRHGDAAREALRADRDDDGEAVAAVDDVRATDEERVAVGGLVHVVVLARDARLVGGEAGAVDEQGIEAERHPGHDEREVAHHDVLVRHLDRIPVTHNNDGGDGLGAAEGAELQLLLVVVDGGDDGDDDNGGEDRGALDPAGRAIDLPRARVGRRHPEDERDDGGPHEDHHRLVLERLLHVVPEGEQLLLRQLVDPVPAAPRRHRLLRDAAGGVGAQRAGHADDAAARLQVVGVLVPHHQGKRGRALFDRHCDGVGSRRCVPALVRGVVVFGAAAGGPLALRHATLHAAAHQ